MFAMHTRAKQIARGAADALRALRFPSVVAQSDGFNNFHVQRCFAAGPSFEYEPDYSKKHDIVRKSGVDVLHDPLYNKGTGFPHAERERLGVRGLLPPGTLSMERQAARVLDDYQYGRDFIDPSHVKDGGVTKDHTRQWKVLQELQDRNETLFYKVLLDNFSEMAPIVYTPTVGWACLNYHKLYRRPRGMFFSANDKNEMSAMIWNWPAQEVDAVVVTDGSRILGLGDLGLNGLGISIGKLDLYCAAAGFHPARVMPCVIDVGTDNEALRNDPMYMGLQHPRLQGDAYFEILDEFVEAVMSRWPKTVLQFEDFQLQYAHTLLQRYKHQHLVFNDDIQGTAATALAGVYGALKVQGTPAHGLTQQRIVVLGAGSAGMGVSTMMAQGMVKHGLDFEDAAKRFWILDKNGLITRKRPDDELSDVVRPFAAIGEDDIEGEDLLSVVKRVKPTILIGLSGAGPLFTAEVLTAMGACNERPIIFPMSNPTYRSECTSDDAQKYTGGRAIFASGSPQPDAQYEGRRICSSQANNMYIFPGLAMGAHLGQTGIITDMMMTAAAEALPKLIPQVDLDKGVVYPRLSNIRQISQHVAMDVIKIAAEEGHLSSVKAMRALANSDEALLHWIDAHMYKPKYNSLIRLPTGVLE